MNNNETINETINVKNRYTILSNEFDCVYYAYIRKKNCLEYKDFVLVQQDLLRQGYVIQEVIYHNDIILISLGMPCCETCDCPSTCSKRDKDE